MCEHACVHASERTCIRACVRAYVRACVRAYVLACKRAYGACDHESFLTIIVAILEVCR